MSSERRRIRDLWTRALAGHVLSCAEEEELFAAIRDDEALRDELDRDEQLDGILQTEGRSRKDAGIFVREFNDRLEASKDATGFMRKIESRVLGERRPRRRRFFAGERTSPVGWIAVAACVLLGFVVFLSIDTGTPPMKPRETAKAEPVVQNPPPVVAHQPEPVKPVEPPPVAPPLKVEDKVVKLEPVPPPVKAAPVVREDAVKPEPAPAPTTVAAMARLEDVRGVVYELSSRGRAAAAAGRGIPSGGGLETADGSAAVVFPDGTRLVLEGGSKIAEMTEDDKGKRVSFTQGRLQAAVVKQKAPMVLTTPHAETVVVGTRFAVEVTGESTWLEVAEGSVRMTRPKEMAIAAGRYAVAAPGFDAVARPLARLKPADPRRVEDAIRRGVVRIRKRIPELKSFEIQGRTVYHAELMLWTLLHAGVPESDPDFQILLKDVLGRPLERTYEVAVQAMVLEELDRVKHRTRIWQCAQFLADNQCANGQWHYGDPSLASAQVPPEVTRAKAGQRFVVKKTRDGPESGDSSNSYYAALGLKACSDAGIAAPREVVERARKWWQESRENGWSYKPVKGVGNPTGSMTAAGVSSLVALDGLLGYDWRQNRAVVGGLDWLARTFTVKDNPGYNPDSEGWSFRFAVQYLYAVERAGLLCGVDKLGKRDWYAEGSAALLAAQQPDGLWPSGNEQVDDIWDTCFAVLFLRRTADALEDARTR